MNQLVLSFAVLLACMSGGAPVSLVPTDVISAYMGCKGAADVSACIQHKFAGILAKAKIAAVAAAQLGLGGVGADPITGIKFPAVTVGVATVSGADIRLTGISTLKVVGTKLKAGMLTTTLVVDKLEIEGDFTVSVPPLVKGKAISISLSLSGLRATAKFVFDRSSKVLIVKDVDVTMSVEEFSLKLKNLSLFDGLVNFWLNDIKKLNKKTLPWLSGFLADYLKDTLNKYLARKVKTG